MSRTRLGRTRVEVTALGFGAAAIGNLYTEVSDDDAQATVDAAWTAGVRYFDTAPHYGLGLSETRLGRALAGRPRSSFTVSTKVGRLLEPIDRSDRGARDAGFEVAATMRRVRDYSRDGVRRSLDDSLRRLQFDRVDIVYVHDPEEHMDEAIKEALPALAALRDEGVIGAIGAGMNFVEPLRRIVAEADVDAVMVAGRWTLADRSAEPLLADCLERGVAVAAAAPFNSGLLATSQPADDAYFDYAPAPGELVTRARDLARTCAAYGVELPQAALQFPLRHPAVACVVAGVRTPHEAASAARRLTEPTPAALWDAL